MAALSNAQLNLIVYVVCLSTCLSFMWLTILERAGIHRAGLPYKHWMKANDHQIPRKLINKQKPYRPVRKKVPVVVPKVNKNKKVKPNTETPRYENENISRIPFPVPGLPIDGRHQILNDTNEYNMTRLRALVLENEVENCQRRLPGAIMVGMAKCGTGTMGYFLSRHPQIAMQLKTGYVAYFDRHYLKEGVDWYRNRMPCSTPDQITMEKTNSYFRNIHVPKRIQKMNPKMKIIVLLREPVERTVSQYLQMLTSHPEPLKESFEDSVYNYIRGKVRHRSTLVSKSVYVDPLNYWLTYFPRSQIHLVDSLKFQLDPVYELKKIEQFLGISDYFKPEDFPKNDRGFHCMQLPEEIVCMPHGKGRKHPDVDPVVTDALYQYFKPFNKQLFKVAKQTFDWEK